MRLDRSLLAAAETIRFQPNSSLATKLVAHCQQAIDWVNDTRNKVDDNRPTPLSSGRINQVVRYLKGNWSSDLEKLILAELNLKAKVCVYGSQDPNAAVQWKIDGSADEFYEQYARVSGVNKRQNYADTLDAVTRQIGENVSQDTGRLGKYASDHFSIELYTMSGLFTMHEAYFVGEDMIRGEHAAAVIAHELGHAVTVAAGLSAVHQRIDLVRDSIAYAKSLHNDNTLDVDLRTGLNKLKELPSEDKNIAAAIAAGEAALKSGGVDEKRTMLILIDDFYLHVLKALIMKRHITGMLIDTGGAKKMSDILVTEHNVTFNERSADLFVSRHGLAGALGEMMAVTYGVTERGQHRNIVSNFMAVTPVLAQILTCYSVIKMMFSSVRGFGVATITDYDPIIERLNYITKNSYGMFKDSGLPPEVVSEMIAMTDRAKKAADEYNSQTYVKVRHFLWSTLTRLGKAHSIAAALTDANLRSDFAKLQAMTGDLVNNSLYYQSARLRHL